MSYLLEIYQGEKRQVVGTFHKEKSIYKFIESIPFVKKESYDMEDYVQLDYRMEFEDIPDYYEVIYNNYVYIISKFSFVPEDEIYFGWNVIHEWDVVEAEEKTLIEGATLVDAYSVENNEVKEYIDGREELFKECKSYYERSGLEVGRSGIGSEDGEYVTVDGWIKFLLDGSAVEIWESTGDFEGFLKRYDEEWG